MRAKLKFFPQIYIGESLKNNKLFILKNRLRRCKEGIFIITPSVNDDEMLEIIEAKYLGNELYKDRHFIVGGIASSNNEANLLVAEMVENCLKKRNDFNVKEYIKCGLYF